MLKRRRLLDKRRALLWQTTPSPEPDSLERQALLAKNKAEYATLQAEYEARHTRHVAKKQEGEEDALCSADEEELTLFMSYITEHRETIRHLKEAAQTEAAAEEAALMEANDVGPMPILGPDTHLGVTAFEQRADMFMRPGEGDAMASYVQSGKRIPRRGEVGLDADTIAKMEDIGYVMSGNRHARMNAIRIRKENQVYTAEEKAALAMINFEEKKIKEEKMLDDLKKLVEDKMGEAHA